MGRIFAGFAEFRYRGPVGASADEDLVDILSMEFSISAELECNFLVKRVDEEVKKLVFVYFIVCSLGLRHTFSKQTSRLTGFVKY
jgi:hypothetical protein